MVVGEEAHATIFAALQMLGLGRERVHRVPTDGQGRMRAEALPVPQRREIQLAQAECALRGGFRELARSLMTSLLEESRDDELARLAAESLSQMVAGAEHGRLPMLLGRTFQQHKEFELALRQR